MKRIVCLFSIAWASLSLSAQESIPAAGQMDPAGVMSEAYWQIWNPEVQAEIDRNIEQYRKADAELTVPARTKVTIEQLNHAFIFGGNIFLFDQLATPEMNARYKQTFGSLFNAATLPFYWKTLEPEYGKPRYEAGSPYSYRRPPVDPIVDFCEQNHLLAKGHAIIYGMRMWGQPTWMPENRKEQEFYFERHFWELAERYGNRIQMWDVVNEPTDQANRGTMPDDYTYKCFRWAMEYFPEEVIFNINDMDLHWDMSLVRRYVEVVRNLIDRGVRIDNVGAQMHIFNPKEAPKIAAGEDILTPAKIQASIDCLSETNRPIHISEVTICAPDTTEQGKQVQAVIARNLYRLWFSSPNITGITWWNVADGGGAQGEPSYSGIYDVQMQQKPVYGVLDELINRTWHTRLTVTSDRTGVVKFRGFKGRYRATWVNKQGEQESKEFDVL